MSEDVESPKIQFPCSNYPIKVMGYAGEGFREFVYQVMERHDAGFDRSRAQVRPSRTGRFESVNVEITATGAAQLSALFADLKQNPAVQMVL